MYFGFAFPLSNIICPKKEDQKTFMSSGKFKGIPVLMRFSREVIYNTTRLTMTFKCPKCKGALDATGVGAGSSVRCEKCCVMVDPIERHRLSGL